MGEMQHSVESLSPMTLCTFDRGELLTLYKEQPSLAYDVTWLAAREEIMLDENLLSVGRRTAIERVSYLIAFLVLRGRSTGLFAGSPRLPLTQQHVADTLGLSLVHTNKTIRRLAERGLLSWCERGCQVLDLDGLQEISRWDGLIAQQRPFI